MTVTVPPRSTDAADDRDLAQRVADLEALIEQARRRTRRRRRLYAAVVLAAIAAGVAASFGLGGNNRSGAPPAAGAPAPSPAHPGPGRWEPSRGPDGGGGPIAVDPADRNVLYSGGWGNVFKSTDGGISWKDITTEPWTRVNSVAIDPTRPRIVYAGTDRGVAKTTDGGRHWRMVNGGLPEYAPGGRHGEGIYSLVVDAHHPQTVFATSQGALIRTTDGGAHWHVIGPEPYRTESCPHCVVLIYGYEAVAAIDPDHAETLYASWVTRGPSPFYESLDGGTSWHLVETQGFPGQFASLTIDGTSGTLYATALTPGVYKSVDGGSIWSSAGLAGQTVDGLHVDSGTLYASVANALDKTTDGGATWEQVGEGPNRPTDEVVADPRGSSTLYGTGNGVAKSLDGGATWAAADHGLVSTLITSVVFSPGSSNVLYAGSYGEVFKSVDRGRTWRRGNGFGNAAAGALAVDPRNRSTIYAGTYWNGLYESTNAGTDWRPVAIGLPSKTVGAIAIDPRHPSTMYVGVGGFLSAHGSLLKTADGGTTWRKAADIPWAVQSLALDPRDPSTVFAGTVHGLYRSRDDGDSWRRITTASPAPNGMYSNLGFPDTFVAIAIDPVDPENVYAGIRSHGILRSSDGGDTWTAADAGLTDERITALSIDPHDPRILYAAAAGGLVFRSTDGARSWHPFGAGLVHGTDDVTAFAIGPTGREVFAATEGDGVVQLRFGD